MKVKSVWDQYLDTHTLVALKDKVDGKVMHENLVVMASEYASGKILPADIDRQIQSSFIKYVGDNKKFAKLQ